MEQRKKRISLVALVGTLLLVAVLASLASSTWATPEQMVRANNQTIPQKYCDDDLLAPGQSTEMRILLTNPSSAPDTWLNTVVTDTVDENLQITGLHTTLGNASWTGRNVTFTIGTMAPDTSVIMRIEVDVKEDAERGHEVYNTAYMSHVGWSVACSDTWMFDVAHLQYLPLAMKRFP